MKATRLLLGLLLLGAAAGAFLLLRSDPTSKRESSANPTSQVATPLATKDVALQTPDPTNAQLGSPQTLAPARNEVELARSAGARVLHVEIAIPDSAPIDPDLSVVAVSKEALDGDEPDELLQRLRAEGDPTAGFARAGVAYVDGNAVAELQLPADLTEPLLVVDGRFLYVRKPREVAVDATQVSIEPQLGGLLEVRLVTPAGEAPRGRLRLLGGDFGGGRDWHDREQAVSDADVLEFRGVDPDLTWTLMPSLEEHHAEMSMGVEVTAGHELEIEVEVTNGATVSGEVVDGEGRPMDGVEVTAGGGMPWMGGGDARSVETAADGSFALRGLAPGVVEVEAQLDGWLGAETGELQLADGEQKDDVRLVLERGLSIAGVVRTADAEPVEGASVVVERLRRQNWGGFGGGSRVRREGRATTGTDGRFVITGLEQGRFTVRAALADEVADVTSRAVLEGVEAGGAEVFLDLLAPITFAGRVVDDLGEPVAAFQVEVESIEQGGPEERQSFEDPEGRYRFGRVGPGEWQVRVEAVGHVQAEEVEHVLPDDGGELVLRMERTARIEGMVVGPTGAPIAGASVRGDDGSGGGDFGGWGRPSGPQTETEADGRFVLEEVAPGPLILTAQADGWADSLPTAFELVPSEAREDVVLALRVGGRIAGQVLTPEGEPLAGRRVTWGSNAMGFGSRGETTSDAGGRFDFDRVTPGEWSVSAVPSFEELGSGMRAGGQSAFAEVMGNLVTKTVTVADGELVEVFLGGEPRQPVRIFGTVTRAGKPLAGAQVFAVSESSAVFEGMKTALADASGSYEVIVDRPGPHTISANAENVGVEEVVEVPREEELRVDLAIPLGRIDGLVLEPDGSPAAGVRLALQRDDGLGRIRWAGGQSTADESGRYSFEDLGAGSYTVRANVSSWGGVANDRFGAAVRDGVVVAKDQGTSGVDFELEAAGSVKGITVGANGDPVAGASLYFRDGNGRLVTRISSVVSDVAGRFEKSGLAPGEYTVSARAEGLTAGDDVAVRVASDQAAEVRVVLEQGTMVLVRLEDEGGEARRSRVEVLDGDGREVGGLITMEAMRAAFNEGGSPLEQRVGPIPPGRYTIRATTAGGETHERRVRLRAKEAEKRVVLKLDG